MNYTQFNRLRRLKKEHGEAVTYEYFEHCERLSKLYSRLQESALAKLDENAKKRLDYEARKQHIQEMIIRIAQVEDIPRTTGSCYDVRENPRYAGRIVMAEQVFEEGCQKVAAEADCMNCIDLPIPMCHILGDIMDAT